jgi:hypothetical protein
MARGTQDDFLSGDGNGGDEGFTTQESTTLTRLLKKLADVRTSIRQAMKLSERDSQGNEDDDAIKFKRDTIDKLRREEKAVLNQIKPLEKKRRAQEGKAGKREGAMVTFFKSQHSKHTNFALESIKNTATSGQGNWGDTVSFEIQRNADLLKGMHLEITLPKVTTSMVKYAKWVNYVGEAMIQGVKLLIGGQQIDHQYGEWMHIWNQLTMSKEQESNYQEMVGYSQDLCWLTDPEFNQVRGSEGCTSGSGGTEHKATEAVRPGGNLCEIRNELPHKTLFVPLQFWFCRNPGLSLPLIALQFHRVNIEVNISPLDNLLYCTNDDPTGNADATLDLSNITMVDPNTISLGTPKVQLYIDYIYLDSEERQQFAKNKHQYLIEQVQQYHKDKSAGDSTTAVVPTFNHPIKELVWVIKANEWHKKANLTNNAKTVFGLQPFNFSDGLDVLPQYYLAYGAPGSVRGPGKHLAVPTAGGMFSESGPAGVAVASHVPTAYGDDNDYQVSGVSDAGITVLAKASHDMHCWGGNTVCSAILKLNGQDRQSARSGGYYNLVQPYEHHTRGPNPGINVFSFALRPEEHQPSGTCNFSRIDNVELQLSFSSAATAAASRITVYALNYNILNVENGMGGVMYSN